MFKGKALGGHDQLTDEMWDLIGKMVEDPDESWFGAMQEGMKALGRARCRSGSPRTSDRLVHFLRPRRLVAAVTRRHERGLAEGGRPIHKHYRQVLPAVAEIIQHHAVVATLNWSSGVQYVVHADASVRQARRPSSTPASWTCSPKRILASRDPIVAPGGQVTPNQTEVLARPRV
jgi:hypothetical protein